MTSCNFRSLWWLVTREAAWLIVCRRPGYTEAPYTRRGFITLPTWRVRQKAARVLHFNEARRIYP